MATYNNARFKWMVHPGEPEVMTDQLPEWIAMEADGVAEAKALIQALQRDANDIEKNGDTSHLSIKIKYNNVDYDPVEEVI
tara:strand:+ start:6933 stop:7175 length:243 start_codon:yes stop_codon:yes gene_type:complete